MLLMHNDTVDPESVDDWESYLDRLRTTGRFEGGSSLAGGSSHRRQGAPALTAGQLVGYLIVAAEDLDQVVALLEGNPVYEAGGTVEIRELIED
jgi:hypothetical protein